MVAVMVRVWRLEVELGEKEGEQDVHTVYEEI